MRRPQTSNLFDRCLRKLVDYQWTGPHALLIIGEEQADWLGRPPVPTLADTIAKYGPDMYDPPYVHDREINCYYYLWPEIDWRTFNRLRRLEYIAECEDGTWRITPKGRAVRQRPNYFRAPRQFSKYRFRQLTKAGKFRRTYTSRGTTWAPPTDVAMGRLRTRKPKPQPSRGYSRINRQLARNHIAEQLDDD